MEDGSISSVLLLIALILFHGGMELTYAVLTNVRRNALRERVESGDQTAKRILRLTENVPQLYITAQVFLMLVKFAIVAIATVDVAEPLLRAQEAAGNRIIPELGYLAVLFPIALLTYILGDLVPSALGNAYADQLAPLVATPLRLFTLLLSPLVKLFMSLSDTISRITGGEEMDKAVTEEEIMTLVEDGQKGGAIEDEEREMIYSVLQFGETLAREVMVPRLDLTAVECNTPLSEVVKVLMETGHSRIPVYEEDIDNIKGLLYAKDLLKLWNDGTSGTKKARELMRHAYFVPETKRADVLFKELQDKKVHLAVIVDEYGGTAGIVTIEDLIEEIVGDIQDEYDLNEEAEYTEVGENAYIVDGGMNLGDLNELLDIDLPTDENDSIGGYVYSQLGHVPDVGETITTPTLHMRVDEVENRRIRKVYIARVIPPAPETDDAPEEAPRTPKSTPVVTPQAKTAS
ncbi:MAG: HlyC/CorC family transporter [Chloroflexi bacterium]|uniref:hemolysin family protein n=1 Tax=Candidatus Flexifilum breve TaxID=3140694 RepID=UPI00313572F0|nr:HlyC/CorC family transporter [Chloroflexota bacterium]MBK9748183.1 HlyC/CorC family transporter [Chloroflexota bacterium]